MGKLRELRDAVVDARHLINASLELLEVLELINDYADMPEWLQARIQDIIARAKGK